MLRNEVDVYVEMWNAKPNEIKQFISEFNELTQTQQRRESFGILYNLELTEEQDGRMLERAFCTLSSFDVETAERLHAIHWVMRAAKSYPELYDEIIDGIELVKDIGTPAWKRYSSKLILKLEMTKAKAFNSKSKK